MKRKINILGAILGLTAVLLGAFGAHGLKEFLSVESLNSFETGVRYQIYHAFLLFCIAGVFKLSKTVKRILFWLLLSGIILFSGSIYLLATQTWTGVDFSSIAIFTPIGGTLLIISWIILCYHFMKR